MVFNSPTLLENIYSTDMKEVTVINGRGRAIRTCCVHPLDEENMQVVPEDCPFGNYEIGYVVEENGRNNFKVIYVGRSDSNDQGLRGRISDHIGEYGDNLYFHFSQANSVREAYEEECEDYHTFDSEILLNKYHPAKPEGEDYPCPVCHQ